MAEQAQAKLEPDLARLRINRDEDHVQQKPAMKPPLWAVGLVLLTGLVLVLAVYGLGWFSPSVPEVEVAIVTLQGGSIGNEVLTANGYVVAQRQASLSAKATGRLEYLAVEEGDRVDKDGLIGYVEQDILKAGLLSAKADLGVAKALLAEGQANRIDAEREWKRQAELLKNDFTTQADYDASETKAEVLRKRVRSAEAQVKSAQAQVKVAEVNLEDTFIRAPFAGTITRKDAEIGEIVAPISLSGSIQARGAIATIADMSSLEVEVDVNESYIARLWNDQPAEIVLDAFPSDRYQAKIRQIIPTADRQKATVQVKVKFIDPNEKILPEMGAKVVFLDRPVNHEVERKILVPESAVINDDGARAVMVVDDNVVRRRVIRTGVEQDGKVEVKDGLIGGEVIVVSHPDRLSDGDAIKLKEAAR